MRRNALFCAIVFATAIASGMCWEEMHTHLPLLKHYLILLKRYCHAHPLVSYPAFAVLLGVTILLGLPLSTVWMLSAGLFYSFWEASGLILASRITAAMISFGLARRVIEVPAEGVSLAPVRKGNMRRMLERHPHVGLFLVRLAPLPDGFVNYTSAAAPISRGNYMLVSLLGMIPFTLFCAWTGNHLGTISHLIRWLK